MGEIQKAKQYNQEVFHILNQSHHLWYTENRMLNIILNEKLCHKNLQNVKLELDIQEHCLDRINEMDITTIFANLLDNAIEAIGRRRTRTPIFENQCKRSKGFFDYTCSKFYGKCAKTGKEA